jgi:hypothetical protein
MYDHGEPWWNDIDQAKLLIRSTELWQFYQQNSTSSYLVAKQVDLARETMNLALQNICSYFEEIFNMP